jgi:tocopherol O-methyltransferase
MTSHAPVSEYDAHRSRVIDYYADTRPDYRLIWRTGRSSSLHFGYYDREHTDHNAAVLNLNAQLADLAGITAQDRVLDAGCGVGGSTVWLAGNRGCRVTGVDITPGHLEDAALLAHRRGLASLADFILANFARTPFAKESFSVVWAVESIVHAPDRAVFLAEAFRLLRPGGVLLVCEYLLASQTMTAEDAEDVDQWCAGWAMLGLLTENQYRGLLDTAGFEHATVHDWTPQVAPSLARLARFVRAARPILPTLRRLKMVNTGRLANFQAAEHQLRAFAHGCWRYQVVMARKPKEA